MTCDNYVYYFCCGLTRDIIVIIGYLWDGSTSGIFTMIVSFKALYVVSLRRPTVAFLLKPFYVVSLRRPTVAFLLKPFM